MASRVGVVSEDFRKQVLGYGLTTAQILYRMPDHPSLLQTYVWQNYDLFPKFPALQDFLAFWQEKLDGPLHSVIVAHSRLIKPAEFRAIDGAKLGWLNQPGMRHDHRVEGAIELFLPKGEEILECREFRKQIVILPDIGLQQRGMIRHPIEDLCRGQPVPQDLLPKIIGNHAKLHSFHAAPFQQIVFAVAGLSPP